MKYKKIIKITLLLTSMMTMMAGAVIAPSLPQISRVFSEIENIALLSRLVITLPALFIAFFSPIFGNVSDRIGRKNILLISLLVYAIGGASGYYLNNIYLILAGRALLGISVGGIMTMVITLIGDYYSDNERNSFMGLQGAFMAIGGIVFISFSGLLADIQWQLPFLIYLFAIPVFILGVIYLFEPKVINHEKTNNRSIDYDRKLVYIINLLAFIGIVFFYMIPVQLPFLLSGFEHISNLKIGIAIGFQSLSSAIISLNYRKIKEKFTFRQIFQIAFLLMGIGFLVISYSDTYLLVLLGLAISGLGTGLLMPSGSLWILNISPEKIRGKLIGRISMSLYLGQFFSPILLQPLISQFDVGFSFLIVSISLGIISVILFALKTSE